MPSPMRRSYRDRSGSSPSSGGRPACPALLLADLDAVPGRLVNQLPPYLAVPGWFLLRIEAAGWRGGLRDRLGSGQAELCCQPWTCGQSRCPSRMSPSAMVSARIIAVIAVLRSRIWPGSQDTSHRCWGPGACRAVWAVWSLVIVVSLMVRVMAVTSGSGSWFGFQVWLWFAGASGFNELGE